MTGKVKFWNSKGYGFIEVDGREEDVFVHFTAVQSNDEFKSLKQNDIVEFEIVKQQDGRESAANVVVK
ncbi:MAG: cold-shock protein [Mycoplasmatales bacterium]|nr:cold-shock protein [Mycoplasmatales bacterium]